MWSVRPNINAVLTEPVVGWLAYYAQALGRKNLLFAGFHKAVQNAAMIYSFFGSCKVQGINPQVWLEETLKKIPDHSIQKLEELLPGYPTDKP